MALTVAELIDLLRQVPQDYEVVRFDRAKGAYHDACDVSEWPADECVEIGYEDDEVVRFLAGLVEES